MSHVRLLAAALVLVGPAMASAQPAAFAPATQSLAQSALTRNNNDFAGAVRQMGAALAEWDQHYNASPESLNAKPKKYSASRAASKVKRIIRTLPDYLKDA